MKCFFNAEGAEGGNAKNTEGLSASLCFFPLRPLR
jgi:hypothetical protein